jgi:hypothetical protein
MSRDMSARFLVSKIPVIPHIAVIPVSNRSLAQRWRRILQKRIKRC